MMFVNRIEIPYVTDYTFTVGQIKVFYRQKLCLFFELDGNKVYEMVGFSRIKTN